MNKNTKIILAIAAVATITTCCHRIYLLYHSSVSRNVLSFHYKYIEHDTLKLKAAMFLLDNIGYHVSVRNITEISDDWKKWRNETDNIMHDLLASYDYDKIPRDTIRAIRQKRDTLPEYQTMPEFKISDKVITDEKLLSTAFLISHINNAFKVWRSSEFARELSFDKFKEYILPYRSLRSYGFVNNVFCIIDQYCT